MYDEIYFFPDLIYEKKAMTEMFFFSVIFYFPVLFFCGQISFWGSLSVYMYVVVC